MRTSDESIPRLSPTLRPSLVVGEAGIGRTVTTGVNLDLLAEKLLERSVAYPDDMGLLLDISVVLQLASRREDGLAAQRRALARQQVYRVCGANGPPAEPCFHLLALVAPGDLMTNTPLEFIVEALPVRLDLLFVLPDQPLPDEVPDHDAAFVAVSQSEECVGLLARIARFVGDWPRPVVQNPAEILRTSREGVSRALDGIDGLEAPLVHRVERNRVEGFARGELHLGAIDPQLRFPILLRPIESHAGQHLGKIDDPPGVGGYLATAPEPEFYLTQYVEYAGPDGQYRKYRVAIIEGKPYLCHMAVSNRWMVHYAKAGMGESEAKRAEEQRAMEEFDAEFALRHASAFAKISERFRLEYFGVDCGETPEGRLLVFEADSGMVIHAMDPPDLFPYKQTQMRKVFAAFYDLLERARARPPGLLLGS